MRRPTLPTIRISFGFSIGSGKGNLLMITMLMMMKAMLLMLMLMLIKVMLLMLKMMLLMLMLINIMMMITNDQEALDCFNGDGEAESNQENCIDQRSHHLDPV